eukprot:828496-Amphidinium_carterae.1
MQCKRSKTTIQKVYRGACHSNSGANPFLTLALHALGCLLMLGEEHGKRTLLSVCHGHASLAKSTPH